MVNCCAATAALSNMTGVSCIDECAAQHFLEDHLGHQVSHVEYVGEGAWSRCFGLVDRGRGLVVRFGRFIEDFEKDRHAASLRSPQLPVPEMLAIGRAFDGFFAITSRAHGSPGASACLSRPDRQLEIVL